MSKRNPYGEYWYERAWFERVSIAIVLTIWIIVLGYVIALGVLMLTEL